MPLPRSLNVDPAGAPSGTFSDSGSPRIDGTVTSPPSASVGEVDRDLAVEIVAVAAEELVVLHLDHDVEIAGRTARRAVLAFALQPQPLTGGDARRDLHGELALLRNAALAVARGARLGDTCPTPRHWLQVRATVKKPCW